MGPGTIVPEMVTGFAESLTRAVEVGEAAGLSAEEAAHIAGACREVRQKFDSMLEELRTALTHGSDVATFTSSGGPLLARLEPLVSRYSVAQAKVDRVQKASPEMQELFSEFEACGQAITRFHDLLGNILAKMKTPRHPMDLKRVREAQAAYVKGATKPSKVFRTMAWQLVSGPP